MGLPSRTGRNLGKGRFLMSRNSISVFTAIITP
jgi:hypothetical protein